MPIAILIGFEYTFNSFTGAIINIYHAYRWCELFNFNIQSIKAQDNYIHITN
jgi:hypothetical protein